MCCWYVLSASIGWSNAFTQAAAKALLKADLHPSNHADDEEGEDDAGGGGEASDDRVEALEGEAVARRVATEAVEIVRKGGTGRHDVPAWRRVRRSSGAARGGGAAAEIVVVPGTTAPPVCWTHWRSKSTTSSAAAVFRLEEE